MIEYSLNGERLTLTVTGGSDVCRFALNLLDDQVDFMQVGRAVLVEQRERAGAKRWDAWVLPMLGAERFKRLLPYFRRDRHCTACERPVGSGGRRLPMARTVCQECAA